MLRCYAFGLLLLFRLSAHADDILPVKIGDTEIKLSCPPGMSDLPQQHPMFKAVADLTPPDYLLLRSCVSSEALDQTKPPDPTADIMTSRTFALKELTMDIGSGTFIDVVQQLALRVSHGILLSQNSSFDYVETEKRLDDFQKDSGIGEQDDGDLYSLGIVSRSDACIAFMTAQYLNVTEQGKTQREKCVSVYAFVRLKQKVVVVLTTLIKPGVLHEDIRTLKHAAEKYQLDLQVLNNM